MFKTHARRSRSYSTLTFLGVGVCLALAPTSGARAASEPEIERVEITGVSALGNPEIEAALEVGPGEPLEKAKVLKSMSNLTTLYQIHGFENAHVKSEFVRKKLPNGKYEYVLEFNIAEGDPSRVAAIRFLPEGVYDESSLRLWRTLQPDLGVKVALGVGEVYDQEKISASKRALQDALASAEFVGAKVDDVRVSSVEAPIGSGEGEKNLPASRWVNLEFHVNLGERVSFGFRGNEFFTVAKLSDLVKDQRALGFGKDYIGSIRNRIEDEYKSSGFARVRLSELTFESKGERERHVTFVIEEGPRVRIKSVNFDGNVVFPASELKDVLNAKSPAIVQHGYYVEKEIQRAAELVAQYIKSKGYLSAKLITINTVLASEKQKTRIPVTNAEIVIYLYEGDQTIVQNIHITGGKSLEPERIKQILGNREDAPLNLFAFSEGLENLKQLYRDQGYLGVTIANEGSDQIVKYSQENHVAEIELNIREGPQYRVGRVQIEGLAHTHEEVVLRELSFKSGEILGERQIAETEARLRKLGIFSNVNIRLSDDVDQAGYKIVRISIQEGTPGIIAGGVGFRNDLGIRLFGQTGYTDLWGRNHTISLLAGVNRRFGRDFRFIEYQTQLAYLWPHFGDTDITFRPAITVSGTEYITFDAFTASAAMTFEKPLLKNPNLSLLLTYGIERVNQTNAFSPLDNGPLRIGTITPALRLDTRDNPFSPTKGFYGFVSFELADPFLGSQNSVENTGGNVCPAARQCPIGYYRTQLRGDYFISLPSDITWYLSFRTGYERNNQPDGYIPLIKQFALGGLSTLRGFDEQQINFQNLSILGTLTYVNYRTQIDFPFAGPLRFGPFLDAANLLSSGSSDTPTYSLSPNLYGVGAGFHYQSPVGPVNLDYAAGFQPGGATQYRFYFSVGII